MSPPVKCRRTSSKAKVWNNIETKQEKMNSFLHDDVSDLSDTTSPEVKPLVDHVVSCLTYGDTNEFLNVSIHDWINDLISSKTLEDFAIYHKFCDQLAFFDLTRILRPKTHFTI